MKYVLAILALLLLGCGAKLVWQNQQVDRLIARLADAQANMFSAQFEASATKAHVEIVTRYVDRVRVVHDIQTILQPQVSAYVPPQSDLTYPLTVGFVRLYNAAVTGELPGPSGSLDENPSELASSFALSGIIGNVASCHETREQLIALQNWLKKVEALKVETGATP